MGRFTESRFGWLRRWLVGHRWPAAAFAGGVVVTVVLVWWLAMAEGSQRADRLADDGARAAEVVRNAVSEGQTRVSALRSLFVASVEVTESEFAAFVDGVGPSPGLEAVGYAVRVPDSEVEEFLAAVESERPGFVDRVGEQTGAPSFGSRFFVWFVESFDRSSDLLGVDISSVPSVAAAIEEASTSDGSVTSAPEECHLEAPCVVTTVAAVYDQGAVSGVVFSVVHLGELLDEIMGESMFEDWTLRQDEVRAVSGPSRWIRPLDVADTGWVFEVTASPAPLWREPVLVLVAGLGLGFSVLAGVGAHELAVARSSKRRAVQLEQLRRERDRFLTSLSHELRTPLTGSLASLRILAEHWRDLDTVELEELVTMAEQQGSELGELMDDLLLVARSDTQTLEVKSERVELMTEATRLLARMPKPDGVTVTISEHDPVALADSGRVRQIFRNLMRNAVRYASSAVAIDGEISETRVTVTVRNDGPPISDARAQQIFAPYSSELEPGLAGSLGIGLHVSRLLAEAMDGTLTYHYDGWANFTLELPRYVQTDQPSKNQESDTHHQ